MTTRERRESMTWRKCAYCGRLMGQADLENAVTVDLTTMHDLEPREPRLAHPSCQKKAAGVR